MRMDDVDIGQDSIERPRHCRRAIEAPSQTAGKIVDGDAIHHDGMVDRHVAHGGTVDIGREDGDVVSARGEGAIAASRTDDLRDLVAWVARETGDIMRVRGELDERNRAVRADVLRLIGRLEVLSALDVAGRIEIASIPGAGNIAALFDSVRAQLVDASERLTGLLGAMVGCDPAITTAAVVTAAERAVDEAEALIAA